MSTVAAINSPRAVRSSWARTKSSAVGVEAGQTELRLARCAVRDKETTWNLAVLPAQGARDADGGEGRGGRSRPPKGRAICAVNSASVDVFPLNLEPSGFQTLEAQVVAHARKHLSVPLEQVVLDFVPLPEAARRPGEESVTVLVFSAPREVVDATLSLAERNGLQIERILTPACAIAQQVERHDRGKRYLAIATAEEATSVSVIQGGHVLLERMLSWSLRRLADRVRGELGLDEPDARALLRGSAPRQGGAEGRATKPALEWTGILPEPRRSINETLSPAFQELTGEAVGCLGYCRSFLKHSATAGVILAGPLAGNHHLRDTLQSELGLPVLGPVEGLHLEGLAGHADGSRFATAACCALWSESDEL